MRQAQKPKEFDGNTTSEKTGQKKQTRAATSLKSFENLPVSLKNMKAKNEFQNRNQESNSIHDADDPESPHYKRPKWNEKNPDSLISFPERITSYRNNARIREGY